MKFQVDRTQLADAVAWTARAVPAKTSMAILLGLLLDVGDDGLVVSAFDYETSAQADVEVVCADAGRALVPGRLLAEITRSLPDAPVDVTVEGGRAHVACGSATFELPTLPLEDYPALPDLPAVAGSLDSEVFATAVGQVAVAAERGETLPTLAGVRVEIDGEALTLVATDRYRLAVRELRWQPQQPGLSATALVPARMLADTAKSLSSGAVVTVSLSSGDAGEGLVGFATSGRRATSRLIDGEFPKYHSLLAAETPSTALLPVSPFTEAVKRVSLVAARNRTAPVIRLAFGPGGASLSAGTGDEAQATETIGADYDGEEITIAFNPTYLLDGLGALDGDTARIGFSGPSKPAILTGESADLDYRYLLMPVRLTG